MPPTNYRRHPIYSTFQTILQGTKIWWNEALYSITNLTYLHTNQKLYQEFKLPFEQHLEIVCENFRCVWLVLFVFCERRRVSWKHSVKTHLNYHFKETVLQKTFCKQNLNIFEKNNNLIFTSNFFGMFWKKKIMAPKRMENFKFRQTNSTHDLKIFLD